MVRGFALTPMGDERVARMTPSGDAQKVAQLLAATTETARFLAGNGLFPFRSAGDMPQILDSARRRGPRARATRLLASPTFSLRSKKRATAIRRARLVSLAWKRQARRPRLSRTRSATGPRRRSTQPARSPTTPARSSRSFATGCASSARGCAARSSRTCAAKTRRSTCRIRSSPSATAATCSWCGPSTAASIPASSTALDERRQPLPRAAEHGRDQQRHRRARGAGSRGGPPHPARRSPMRSAGARSIWRGRSRSATELDVLQARARFSDSMDGVEPALSPTARSSCRRRGIPLVSNERAYPVDHQDRSRRRDVPAHHRPEHRRQDRRAEDRGAAGADGAVRAAHSRGGRDRGCRCSGPCSPTSATSSRSPRASARSPAHITNIVAMDRALRLPALVLLDEVGCRHRPDRRRRARRGDHRSLPPPRRHGDRDDALRRAEDLRVDDRRRDERRVRVRPRDVRADLPADLRIARDAASRSKSRPGSACRRRSCRRAPEPERARGAARRASGESRPGHAGARARAAAGRARTRAR